MSPKPVSAAVVHGDEPVRVKVDVIEVMERYHQPQTIIAGQRSQQFLRLILKSEIKKGGERS